MNDLITLYRRKTQFSAYRSAQEAMANANDTPANALYSQLDAAKQELKAVTAELQAKIAQIKLKLMAEGVPVSKTDRRKAFDAQMRDEKAQIDADFSEVVLGRLQAGQTVGDLVKEVGAPNGSVFYNSTSGVLKLARTVDKHTERIDVDSLAWEYSTHPGTLRYAFSPDRNFVKLHNGDGSHVVLTYPGLSVYAGDEAIAKEFNATRANTLLSVLDGTYEGPAYVEATNPYSS